MKEQAEIIRNNNEFINALINEENQAIYLYLLNENSKEIVTDFVATATVEQLVQALNQYLKIERWALQVDEKQLETSFLVEYQESLLTKLKAQDLNATQKKCLADYQKNIESHMDFIGDGIVNELPNWREMQSNLQLSAKLLRPKAEPVLMQEYEHQAQRLANLLNSTIGSEDEYLKKLTALEALGCKKAISTLSLHYESLAKAHYYNTQFSRTEREDALRNLAKIRKEALYYLAIHLILDGNRLLGFSETSKVKEGIKILNDIKDREPRAYLELAIYYEKLTSNQDYFKSLHYFYLFARVYTQNKKNISAYTGFGSSTSWKTLAEIYLGLLDPLDGELKDYYGSSHLKNAVKNSKELFAQHAWNLSSDNDLSSELQFKLLQIVEDITSLPKQSAQSLAEINKRLHKNSTDSFEKNKMIRCAQILKPSLVANFALVLINDRDIALQIRQGWILLAMQRLIRAADPNNQKQFEQLEIQFNKIGLGERQRLAKELQVVLPENKTASQPQPQPQPQPKAPTVVFFKPAEQSTVQNEVRPPEGEPPEITYPELPTGDFVLVAKPEIKVAQFS